MDFFFFFLRCLSFFFFLQKTNFDQNEITALTKKKLGCMSGITRTITIWTGIIPEYPSHSHCRFDSLPGGLKRQSWTKVLTHLSKTKAFYQRPSVISKNIFFIDSQPPSPPFQCCNTLRGHFHLITTLKRGGGVEMSKLDIEKLTRGTKRVFFRECLNYFCP